MFYFPTQRYHRLQTLHAAIILILIIAVHCNAQTHETTLGVVRSIKTPGSFRYLKQFPSAVNTPVSFVLWSDSTHDLSIGYIDSLYSTFKAEHHAVRNPFDDLFISDLTHHSKSDLILLSKAEQTIRVFVSLKGDTLDPLFTITLPFVPTGWQMGDINNDGNVDIVVYDRNNPGIVPLYGNGRGKFVIGKTIAPDLPVGCLALTRLNNDNLTDMVAYDWVKSELHLLYGVGRGRFLDQSTFPVQGNVRDIEPARVDPESILDLVLVTGGPAEVQVWQGNGIGDFRLAKRATLDQGMIAYALGDMNGDQWMDFGYIGQSTSLNIVMNNGSEWSQDRVQFAAGDDPTSVVFRDFNHDGKIDALVLDRRDKSMRFYFNSDQDNTLGDSLEFATGEQPSGVEIHKSGFGKGNDLAVVNSQGRSLSLFTGREHGGLFGQTQFALSITPQILSFHSMTDSSSRFVVTSRSGDSLLFLSLNFKDSSSSYAVIPSEGFAEVVQVGINPLGQADFFTYNTFAGNQNPAIHYYERLNPGTFIEQSFRLTRPDVLLGATADNMNSDSFPELVYVYRNADSGYVDLVVSYADSQMTYSQRHSTIELSRTYSDKTYLWSVVKAGNDTTDMLLYCSDPTNVLQRVRGRGNGQFDTLMVVMQNVRLANRSMLQIVDADHDGFPDIVLNNGEEKEIGWLRGRPDGAFDLWQPLVSADPQDFFAVGDLNGDGIAEIALSQRKRGVVKVYNGTLIFTKEKNEAER